MFWLNFVKRYLSLIASGDIDAIENMYSDNIVFYNGTRVLNKKELIESHPFLNKPISIKETAYREKYFVLETEIVNKPLGWNLCICFCIEINNGKIEKVRVYNGSHYRRHD